MDLSNDSISGVELIDRYTFRIKLSGIYPQFIYWLAMNFFSPIPWEGDVFYDNEYLKDRNLTFAWYPIGTGPYMLVENNPNGRMILLKNPNFHDEFYPEYGESNDYEKGLLKYKNMKLPFVEQVVFSLEKETVPRWNKFLQGYYDFSNISSDSFDEAIKLDIDGEPQLTDKLITKKIFLQTSIAPTIFYIGFNMDDKIIGGDREKSRNLRQAISIAIDFEEYITIFLNVRGVPATNPVPQSILMSDKIRNEYIYDYDEKTSSRKKLKYAIELMDIAGYKDGIDPKTGKPLMLNFDAPVSSSADDKEKFNWLRKQFRKLGISLNIRATHYNRFQDKIRDGNFQMFMSGWHADYPDPENFLFLFYSKNSRTKYGGENYSNYSNDKFDLLFDEMQNTPSITTRNALAIKMIKILQYDSPWVWGFYPRTYTLSHVWNNKSKPSEIAYNTLKYKDVDIKLRNSLRKLWNVPNFLPILVVVILLIISILPVFITYRKRKYKPKYRK
ncbi:MAG: peptide ABC transporter substrate-binding protein [Legionellales bacterium]|nr:peptide ABC transporter substrate-binding protein [Legionellales bacterium]